MQPQDGPPRTFPAVVYAARSQAEEPGKDSTGDQLTLIRAKVEREGDRAIVAEHTDHASGYRGDRGPGLEAAMARAVELARTHETVELWVWTSSRLARGSGLKGEARSVLEVFAYLRRNGVTLRSVEDDQFVTSPMLVGFAAEQAEKYSRDLAANVRRGIAGRAEREGKPWGEPAYGYARGDDGHWREEPTEAAIAARIFRMRATDGLSCNAIANALNRQGVPTRRGGNWTASTVRTILTGRQVLGEFRLRGEWHKGRHPAIVDEGLWRAAQALAARDAKFAPSRAGRRPARHLLIGGTLRCAACGEAMLPRSATDPAGDYYVCRTNKQLKGKGGCEMPNLARAATDAAVLRLFERHFLDLDATRERVAAELDAQLAEVGEHAARADRAAASAAGRLARVRRDYVDGAITASDWNDLRAELDAEDAAARAERDRLAEHAREIRALRADLDAEHETLRRIASLRDAVAAHVRTAEQRRDVDALRAALAQVGRFAVDVDGRTVMAHVRVDHDDPFATGDVAIPLATPNSIVRGSGVPE